MGDFRKLLAKWIAGLLEEYREDQEEDRYQSLDDEVYRLVAQFRTLQEKDYLDALQNMRELKEEAIRALRRNHELLAAIRNMGEQIVRGMYEGNLTPNDGEDNE